MERYSDRISADASRTSEASACGASGSLARDAGAHEACGSLAGEVAIVTGGSRGIGRAIVALFAEHGASVAFCGRDEAVGRATARELGHEHRVAFQRADVASEADVEALVAACADHFGPPTILVNNAGVNANFDAVAMTEDEWDRFFAIDLKAAWLAAKHVLPHMQRAGRGSIVNVSSLHGFATLEGFFPYAAAKSGLVGLTRSLALDYGPFGIRVNVVAPGFVRTRLVQESIDRAADRKHAEAAMVRAVALGRIGAPEEIASVVRFLASDEASYVTGASLLVDGGLTARRAG
jgi:NAD(P)-dependent dehydrogenase (short-subunit alcohol dehydrogenase family)